jgi:hypothetical protein
MRNLSVFTTVFVALSPVALAENFSFGIINSPFLDFPVSMRQPLPNYLNADPPPPPVKNSHMRTNACCL